MQVHVEPVSTTLLPELEHTSYTKSKDFGGVNSPTDTPPSSPPRPPSSSAASRLLLQPKLIRNVLLHLDNPSLIPILSTCSYLQHLASPLLYHSITLDDITIPKILRGYDIQTNPNPAPTSTPIRTEDIGGRPTKPIPLSKNPMSRTLQKRNFKSDMLKLVKIITITSHSRTSCQNYSLIGKYFPNLQVLRIVHSKKDSLSVHPLCNPHTTSSALGHTSAGQEKSKEKEKDPNLHTITHCPLLQTLCPKKLVLRNLRPNLSLESIPINYLDKGSSGRGISTLVLWIPNNRDMSSESIRIGLNKIGITQINILKIIFSDTFEVTSGDWSLSFPIYKIMNTGIGAHEVSSAGITSRDIVKQWRLNIPFQSYIEIYGLEKVSMIKEKFNWLKGRDDLWVQEGNDGKEIEYVKSYLGEVVGNAKSVIRWDTFKAYCEVPRDEVLGEMSSRERNALDKEKDKKKRKNARRLQG